MCASATMYFVSRSQLQSPLSGSIDVKQWGVAFSNRWGSCTLHSSCMAYASAIRFEGSEGGGPCTTCGCYCAAHIDLGHYPTRCSCGGCPCAQFRPENDPSNVRVVLQCNDDDDDDDGGDGRGGGSGDDVSGSFNQAHRNTVCGMCGHRAKDHTAPYDRWEVHYSTVHCPAQRDLWICAAHHGPVRLQCICI